MNDTELSIYLCRLLRHRPELLNLDMDGYGWVSTAQLMQRVSAQTGKDLDMERLERIVSRDQKGRYRFSPDKSRIKCCQGHSIPWVKQEIRWQAPPERLYHGTTEEAWEKIRLSGAIRKMDRHHVHMTGDLSRAWQSARRRRGKRGTVLVIDAAAMAAAGFAFGCTENDVWCAEEVPVAYVCRVLTEQ